MNSYRNGRKTLPNSIPLLIIIAMLVSSSISLFFSPRPAQAFDEGGCATWLSNAELFPFTYRVNNADMTLPRSPVSGPGFVWAVNDSYGVVLLDTGAEKVLGGTPQYEIGVRTVDYDSVLTNASLIDGMGNFDVSADGTTYMSAGAAMGLASGGDNVIKIDPTTGVVSIIATIPTNGSGFGDVYYANGYVYVSSIGDGMIYKIDPNAGDPSTSYAAVYDHGLDGRTNAGLNHIIDAEEGNGFNPIGTLPGRRVTALYVDGTTLYYATMWTDQSMVMQPSYYANGSESRAAFDAKSAASNPPKGEIWRVSLDNNGDPIVSTAAMLYDQSAHTEFDKAMPITDMTVTQSDKLVVGTTPYSYQLNFGQHNGGYFAFDRDGSNEFTIYDAYARVQGDEGTGGLDAFGSSVILGGEYNINNAKPYGFVIMDQDGNNGNVIDLNSPPNTEFYTTDNSVNDGTKGSTGDVEYLCFSADVEPLTTPERGAIGNYVWLDENSDGVQDAGERGIPNVIVNLTDGSGNVYTTTTDANGGYLFPDLLADNYTVSINPSNFQSGGALEDTMQTPLSGGNGDFGNKDDAGYLISLGAGEENLSADFGYNYGNANGNDGLGAIGDTIWLDADGDGTQDPNEIGIADVCVELVTAGADGVFGSADDVIVDTTTTNANGNYIFTDLAAGAYSVRVCASNFDPSGALEGWTQTGDPDHFGTAIGTNNNQTTTPIILAPGDVFLNADFGYQPPVDEYDNAIGDTIWFDANGDGIEDVDEVGIAGVTVVLYDANGNAIATATTDENGNYLFENLPDGTYTVCVNDTDNVLGEMAQSGDPDATLDGCSTVTVSNGDTNLDQDFGYMPEGHAPNSGLIGDTIWFDLDNSGGATQDAGEPGIEGVIVTLTDSNGNVVTTTTDENGNYSFGGLDPNGTYTVTIAAQNFQPGGVLEGMSETYDPATGGAGQSVVDLSLDADGIDLDQDWSYGVSGTTGQVGNLVWLDTNADGVFDSATESPIAGVTIDLYRDLNCDGVAGVGEGLFATTTTVGAIDAGAFGANGIYLFDNLPVVGAGGNGGACFIVNVTDEAGVLAGYWQSLGTAGSDDNSQADPYAVTELTSANPSDLTADFGYYVDAAAVGNYVWFDANNDGVQDDIETGLDGVTVTLTITYPNGTTIAVNTLTGDNPATTAVEQGWYSFDNLLRDEDFISGSGTASANATQPAFVISVATPVGYTPTLVDDAAATDLTDSDDHSGVAALPTQGERDVTQNSDPTSESDPISSYDFGFDALYGIGNLVWIDGESTSNGTYNEGTDTLPSDVTMELYRVVDGTPEASPIATVDTVNGAYQFLNLRADTYVVCVAQLEFTPVGDLWWSSEFVPYGVVAVNAGGDDANDDSSDHNAVYVTNPLMSRVCSTVVTLGGAEPEGEADYGLNSELADNVVDWTIDFAFAPQSATAVTLSGMEAELIGKTQLLLLAVLLGAATLIIRRIR